VTPIHCNPFLKGANEQVKYLDLHQFAFPNLAPKIWDSHQILTNVG
jgi:hypothetical protein